MSASKGAVARLAVWMVVALFGIGAFAFGTDYKRSIDDWHSKTEGCKRGKKDRQDNARFSNAPTRTTTGPSGSVQGDVKRAARKLRRTVEATSVSLSSRTGKNLNCAEAFPKPSALPF